MFLGLVFLLIGPSGAGKSSIILQLLDNMSDLSRLVTYTTRPPRDNEENGEDYHFISESDFFELRDENKFTEWQEFYGHLYGSLKIELENLLRSKMDGIAAYDVLGSIELMRMYPNNVITIFVIPPSVDVLRTRLVERYGTKDDSEGNLRLERFDMEMQQAGSFKYVIQNIDLEQAVKDVNSIIIAERCARHARKLKSKVANILDENKSQM